jgi:hypothetical protein
MAITCDDDPFFPNGPLQNVIILHPLVACKHLGNVMALRFQPLDNRTAGIHIYQKFHLCRHPIQHPFAGN